MAVGIVGLEGFVGGVIEVGGVGDVECVGLFTDNVSWGTALRCARRCVMVLNWASAVVVDQSSTAMVISKCRLMMQSYGGLWD